MRSRRMRQRGELGATPGGTPAGADAPLRGSESWSKAVSFPGALVVVQTETHEVRMVPPSVGSSRS